MAQPGTPKAKWPPFTFSNLTIDQGDVLQVLTPGGGGFGNPRERERTRVPADLRNGRISPAAAGELYGLEVIRTSAGVGRERPASRRPAG